MIWHWPSKWQISYLRHLELISKTGRGNKINRLLRLTALIKQAANLMVFQKYFDQWDYSVQTLGDRLLKIVLNNWNAEKVGLFIGEEPTPSFLLKDICKIPSIR